MNEDSSQQENPLQNSAILDMDFFNDKKAPPSLTQSQNMDSFLSLYSSQQKGTIEMQVHEKIEVSVKEGKIEKQKIFGQVSVK